MIQNIIAALIVVGIPVVLLIMRTQAAMVIFAMFAGVVFSQTVGDEVLAIAAGFAKINTAVIDSVTVFIFIITALVLALHYRGSAGTKFILQLLPIFLSGPLALFLVLPLLSDVSQEFLRESIVYREAIDYRELVIAASVLASMLVCVGVYRRSKDAHAGGHKGGKHH